MKIRKTRIQKQTKATGVINYYPQYKGLFFWHDFFDFEQADRNVWGIVKDFIDSNEEDDFKKLRGGTLELAKKMIDFYIAQGKYKNACTLENKVVKTEYERYP